MWQSIILSLIIPTFFYALFNAADSSTLHFINICNNPNWNALPHLRNAIPCLLQFLPLLPLVNLIQGNFNLHCSYWNPDVEHDDLLGWSLINSLTTIGLSLVNDDGEHTFFQGANCLQVGLHLLLWRSATWDLPILKMICLVTIPDQIKSALSRFGSIDPPKWCLIQQQFFILARIITGFPTFLLPPEWGSLQVMQRWLISQSPPHFWGVMR